MKQDWLRLFLPFASGIASHDTFSRVFALLDAKKFEACFTIWMQQLMPTLAGRVIPMDGKSLRGSHDGDTPMTHLVSACDSATGLVLSQVKTATKSNEITAIPALLAALDIEGATVTIDAMGCQREIVKQIVKSKADYIVAVKNNQPSLAQAVESLFLDLDAGLKDGRLQQDITLDKDHGRVETRRCVVAGDLTALNKQCQAWAGLSRAVMIESTREIVNGKDKGQTTKEWRYYISSRDASAAEFNMLIRSHWAIESCHWLLDVAFKEDDCRIRVGDGAQNFAILRRIAMSIIKQDKSSKSSFRIKQKEVGWSSDYLEALFSMRRR